MEYPIGMPLVGRHESGNPLRVLCFYVVDVSADHDVHH
jgi:hypothetical protein